MPKTLRELAEDAGLDESALAAAVGKHRSAVGFWLRGDTRPRSSSILPIARALGVTTDDVRRALAEIQRRRQAGERC